MNEHKNDNRTYLSNSNTIPHLDLQQQQHIINIKHQTKCQTNSPSAKIVTFKTEIFTNKHQNKNT